VVDLLELGAQIDVCHRELLLLPEAGFSAHRVDRRLRRTTWPLFAGT
jgi:hypothetical protein